MGAEVSPGLRIPPPGGCLVQKDVGLPGWLPGFLFLDFPQLSADWTATQPVRVVCAHATPPTPLWANPPLTHVQIPPLPPPSLFPPPPYVQYRLSWDLGGSPGKP